MTIDTSIMTDTTLFDSDTLQRFIFDNAAIRGEWLHLTQSWQAVLTRREYPMGIQRQLGEMMGAVALLASTVKIKGRVVIQVKSEGPVSLAMVECTSDNTVRAFAQWDGEIADNASLTELMPGGTMAITIEVDGAKQPYQGLVSIDSDSIASTLETYFKQSEQLETRIWLTASSKHIAGLLVQQLPSEQADKQHETENWERITHLANTITDDELMRLDSETLLHRLFHEEECRVFDPNQIEFACSCSRERVAETISLLGEHDANALLDEQGKIEVACEFCNEHYHFDKVDVAQVFSDTVMTPSSSKTLH